MALCYIALGSNLGDRLRNCMQAVSLLRGTPNIQVLVVSPVYLTKPVGNKDQPDFVNLVVGIDTSLSALDLLTRCKAIETELGRIPGPHWGPRVMDLDILLIDDLVCDYPGLKIPHPRMHERHFVLEPLAKIAPNVQHPVLGQKISKLLLGLGSLEGTVKEIRLETT